MEINLLESTIDCLARNEKSPDEVVFVTDGQHNCFWNEFAEQAARIDFDPGWGTAEINLDLKVVGPSWWLERHEYDGSEWWEFKQLPKNPCNPGQLKYLDWSDFYGHL